MPGAIPAARNGKGGTALPSRRELFTLAAVLTATVLTSALAVAGLTRNPPVAQPATPTVDQVVTPKAPAPPRRVEPGD